MTSDRPVIEISPAVRFGRPAIRGISTEAIAGMVAAGEDPDVVCSEYGITRHELLLACWWEGSDGVYRKKWRRWAEEVAYPALAGWKPFDVDAMPLPTDAAS